MQNKNVARAICPPDERHTPAAAHISDGPNLRFGCRSLYLGIVRLGRHQGSGNRQQATGDGGCGENGSFDSAALRSGRQDRDVSAVGAAIGRPQKAAAFPCCHSERSEESAPPSNPRKLLRLLIPLLLAVLLLLSCHSIRQLTATQTLQYEAERWQGPSEQSYSQVSVFWNEGEMNAAQAEALSNELRASFPTDEIPPFVTAYGAKSSGLASYAHRRAEAELWSVSKDFFTLHAFSMAEGGPGTFARTGSEAVLNEAAAFALFGSNDCIGEAFQMNGLGWRVIAVIQEPTGAANGAAFGAAPRIFLPIADDASVTFYEAILPEYYSGYATQSLQNATGQSVTSSTDRFRLSRLWEKLKDFFRTPPGETPPLPPWEQAARLAERKLCLDWWIALLASICLLVQLVPLVVNGIKKGVNKFRALRHGRGQIMRN